MTYEESELDKLIQEAFKGKKFDVSPQKNERLHISINYSSLNPWTKNTIRESLNPCLPDEPEKEIPKFIETMTVNGVEVKITPEIREALGL